MLYIGCAGWQLPKVIQADFPGEGTHLTRYAARFPAVEINSSFYRHHRNKLYGKWASEVPGDFRFAVKIPRELTHRQKLRGVEGLETFLGEVAGLGQKLGPLLIQLPPSLEFERGPVETFLGRVRHAFSGALVCEPRHASWFEDKPESLLERFEVSRVAADPPTVRGAACPGAWTGRVYFRLHGYPKRFYSSYDREFLKDLAGRLRDWAEGAETWCVFNNTATEAGLVNALSMMTMVR